VGTFLGGEAGSRLLQKPRMPLCAASLLQSIRTQATEHYPTPRVLGVDDWAIKKDRSYGTILVDLEKHKVVDLLSDRSAAALELWLNVA
jgi:transposase